MRRWWGDGEGAKGWSVGMLVRGCVGRCWVVVVVWVGEAGAKRAGGGGAGWCGDGGKGHDRGGRLWENVKLVEWWWRCWG